MGFSVGIIGLPNVGKSTLINALCHAGAQASNYPFCTIDKNQGTVPVPDERLDKLAEILKPQEVIPTTVTFIDIAGLVKGAHRGEGLGNKFLHHVREASVLAHVLRCFKEDDVSHVYGTVDPLLDIEMCTGFIENIHIGFPREAPGNCHSLEFPATERIHR